MKILLATLHSKYTHASLALPCLAACCRDLPGVDMVLREWAVNEPREHLLKVIMAEKADLIAFSCYIWNIDQTLRIVSDIKKISPDVSILLGGPEVSFGIFDLMHENRGIDYVIKGEGELSFRRLIETLLTGDNAQAKTRLLDIDNLVFRDGDETISGPNRLNTIELDSIPSLFAATAPIDLTRPLLYFETSRGCPFSCAFCLSSVEGAVRSYSMDRIKHDLLYLMQTGVSQIKLVDRTFNYDAARADEIWRFILEHNRGSHFHFEISADLLTEQNFATLAAVPEHTFRFEIGVQSGSQETLGQVGRRADLHRITANVKRLSAETAVELHLDLIAGLPGEGYEGFLESLQLVADMAPHDIQIEPLKLLKGSPMREIASRMDYRFSASPPYTILGNPWLSYDDICRVETIGRLLDLFGCNGGFPSAFRHLQRRLTFSQILDRMARQCGTENLSGYSSRRVFELFARLAGQLIDRNEVAALYDAIFFDYCMREMPLMGRLPDFITNRQSDCSWPSLRPLPDTLDVSPGCRVKGFRFRFITDHRCREMSAEERHITFAYISGAGKGLRIEILQGAEEHRR